MHRLVTVSVLWVAAGAGLVGCASAGRTAPVDDERTVPIASAGARVSATGSDAGRGYTSSVRQSPQTIFTAVQTVYEQLHLPVTAVVPADLRVSSINVPLAHAIDGQRMSRFFNCGEDSPALAAADRYDLVVTVVTSVAGPSAVGVSSTVTTRASARARHPTAESQWIDCQSTGRLESELARTIADDLAG